MKPLSSLERSWLVSGIAMTMPTLVLALSNPGPDPNNGSDWATQTGEITNVVCTNGGNPVNTLYYFGASDATSGSDSVANGSFNHDAVTGHTVISPTAVQDYGGSSSIYGSVRPTLASNGYWVYAQACPSGSSANGGGCTSWIRLKTGTVGTQNLPVAPFTNPANSMSDVTANSIRVRASVSDPGNVQSWHLQLKGVVDLGYRNYDYSAQSIVIGPGGGYSYTLSPNANYTYQGQILYYYNQVTPGTPQEWSFWTRPMDPGAVSAGTPARFSVRNIQFKNSGLSTPNPSGTRFEVGVFTTGGTLINSDTSQVSSTGQVDETFAVAKIGGLNPGTSYDVKVRAWNKGRASGWYDSNWVQIGRLTTLTFNLNLTVDAGTVNTNDGVANITVDNAFGLDHFILTATGHTYPAQSWHGDLSQAFTMTGLSPNTAHHATVVMCESADGSECSGSLPWPASSFTTDAAAPVAPSHLSADATSITASWTDSSNPAGTYVVEYCLTGTSFGGCPTQTQDQAWGSNQSTTITGLDPQTSYSLRVRMLNVTGSPWENSGWFNLGSVATQNNPPSITQGASITPNPVTGTTGTLQVRAIDNGGEPNLTYTWVVNAPGGASPSICPGVNGSNAAKDCLVTFDKAAAGYSATVTVEDLDGATAQSTLTPLNVNGTPTLITISPKTATVITGDPEVFSAIVCDQFETGPCTVSSSHQIANQSVHWTVTGGGTPLSASGKAYTFTATTSGGPYSLTATVGSATPGSASITVVPSGIQMIGSPTLTINSETSAVASARGTDVELTAASIQYTWTLVSGPTGANPSYCASNGTNAAQDCLITFDRAGAYSFAVTLSNDHGSKNGETLPATEPQVIKKLVVATPDGQTEVRVKVGQDQPFVATGVDQFAQAMSVSVVDWSSSIGGDITPLGAQAHFNSTILGTRTTITARDRVTGLTGYAYVVSFTYDVSGALAYPVPYKSTFVDKYIHFKNLGTSAKIRIYTTSGQKVFEQQVDSSGGAFNWDVKNSSGENLASGVYFYHIESPEGKKDGKLIIIQ